MRLIEHQNFDEERALYGSRGVIAKNCIFDGSADGESAFKECSDISVEDCLFNLRYPFWHNHGLNIHHSEMTELCRAAIWYSDHVTITDTKMNGIKALRECRDVCIKGCEICSQEFGWSVENLRMEDSRAESEYFLMRSNNISFSNVEFKGKYSFQYIENAVFEHCSFDTKDAFWHSKNVTVKNSTVKGEYLAWYSEGLTLINCKIIGTQPFCYCRNLKLVDCEMIEADLCFEKSEVEATITTPVISIKNPLKGQIVVPAVGEVIMDDVHEKATIVENRASRAGCA
ncbi:MAG: DUF3737 family protein [Lachnospiraceae bacterium]